MAKAKKGPSIDFQALLLQHGERIGLSGAALIMMLLICLSLFWPGSGVFSGNPQEKAKEISDVTQRVDARLRDPNNLPQDKDKPPPIGSKLDAFDVKQVAFGTFKLGQLIPEIGEKGSGRKEVEVLKIDEAKVEYAMVQVQSYLLDTVQVKGKPQVVVYVVERAGAKGNTGSLGSVFGPRGGGSGDGGGTAGGLLAGGGTGGRGAGGVPGMAPPGEDEPRNRDGKLKSVSIEEFLKGTYPPAEQLRPMRMAVIAGTFPYKAQVEEFKTKLGLASTNLVLTEGSMEKSADGQHLPAFRFLGVEVERQELDGDGNPKGSWVPLDLNKSYRPWLVRTGRRFEPEDPTLAPVVVPGLVMPRLKQFRASDVGKGESGTGMGALMPMPMPMGEKVDKPTPELDQYPAIEKQLVNIDKVLKALEGKNQANLATTSSRFSDDMVDIFSSGTNPTGTGMGMGMGMGTSGDGRPGPRTILPPMVGSPTGMGMGTGMGTDPTYELPEHCLVRLIDLDVKPLQAYQYRLRVKMTNPNYKRPDVANPRYADSKELLSPWTTIPIQVRIPAEIQYYAVDQRDPQTLPKSTSKAIKPNTERQVALQLHRWFNEVNVGEGATSTKLMIGDWSVAERIFVSRGEYVGRRERVELPCWRCTREDFVMLSDGRQVRGDGGTKKDPQQKIGIDFGYGVGGPQPEAILIDFTWGKTAVDKITGRTDDKVTTTRIEDNSAAEALLMAPDGKLLLLEGARDNTDPVRIKRLEYNRGRINDTKKGKAGSGRSFGGGGT